MSIGILYESKEWSNNRLLDCLIQKGVETEMFLVEALNTDVTDIASYSIYANRVFPSADMRGNVMSIHKTDSILSALREKGVRVINSYEAFYYDCSKWKTYSVLKHGGFPVPNTIHITTDQRFDLDEIRMRFPLVAKRDCGGRSHDLRIIHTREAMMDFRQSRAHVDWILQAFIEPVKGYTTRVEVIDGEIMTVLKRFIGREGISSYAMGSRYEVYTDCPSQITADSVEALNLLEIEMGSLDFIEDGQGRHFLIDVNATSNFTPDYIPLLGFDPIERMAEYIYREYKKIDKEKQ